tara:strand:+ start:63839 stop:64399 length:561 start_codon:yes stop_codon:yes gene_type:complete
MQATELSDFVLEEVMTGSPKPSILKRARSKHPTGRGEQKKSAQWHDYDETYINTIIAYKAGLAPSVCEGVEEFEGIASSNDDTSTEYTSVDAYRSIAEYQAHKQNQTALEEAFDAEFYADNDSEFEDEDILECLYSTDKNAYTAPKPDTKIRTWYKCKGAVARLTQRQHTADVCQAIPEDYDPYES